jgi:hypothetical protein
MGIFHGTSPCGTLFNFELAERYGFEVDSTESNMTQRSHLQYVLQILSANLRPIAKIFEGVNLRPRGRSWI